MKDLIALKDIQLNYELFSKFLTEDLEISLDEITRARLNQNHSYLLKHVQSDRKIYGINTGFGKNVSSTVSGDLAGLQKNLALYLDCAQGEWLPERTSRLIFLVRIKQASFSGSAIRSESLSYLIDLFNAGISPIVPTLGSLGASGDLVTMAPMARLLFDEEVSCWHGGAVVSLANALKETKIKIPGADGRDCLALMNGLAAAATLAMTEILKINHLLNISLNSMGLCKLALGANQESESEILNSEPVRNFSGQKLIADSLRRLYVGAGSGRKAHLQDAYALRCIPQFMGPVIETSRLSSQWILQELSSMSDNPYIAIDDVINGGNFYGGYLAQASDLMATNMAKVAELLDRQTFHLVGGQYNLPENLIQQNPEASFHGLKGVHQLSNSLLMKIQPQATSYSLATRSSEMHNQDVVSNCMNGWLRVMQLRSDFETLLSCHLVLTAQAKDLAQVSVSALSELVASVRENVPFINKDQSLREPLKKLKDSLYQIKSEGPFSL
ncbi:MAG: aromatic amino acid lyase [Bacteriovorax sp.]|nr:aromatic amino acid lyase [Bacteriovorax sp.]